MTRRLTLALALTLAIFIGSTGTAVAGDGYGPFVDTDGRLHDQGATAIWHAGITEGCDDWRFCPDEPVTREQMAAFLVRALGLPPGEATPFVDTADSLFEADISALEAAALTGGCAVDRYCPDDPVTRAQLASFLVRALGLPDAAERTDWFTDDGGTVHEGDVNRLAASGVTVGCGPKLYCPDREVTRGEMATLLERALDLSLPKTLPQIPGDVIEEYRAEYILASVPTGPGAEGWRPLVELYFRDADVDQAVRIMECESRGDPAAVNGGSGASGLFQHLRSYWPERAAAAGYGGASILDPEANVAVAAWLAYEYGGFSHWTCPG